MRLKDLTIGTQLRFGLAVVLMFVVFLGGLTWYQTRLLWQETKRLYEHSLEVRRAVGQIQHNILTIHWGMDELFSRYDQQTLERVLPLIETHEAEARRHFGTLFDRYLGPRTHIENLLEAINSCQTNRKDVIALFQAGNPIQAQAINIHKETGPDTLHLKEVKGLLEILADFSRTNADQLYLDATAHKQALNRQLVFVIGLILLLTAGGAYVLFRGVRGPLKELTDVTERFRTGHLEARSQYLSANEFGMLSAAFNQMAQAISLRIESEKKSAAISETLIVPNELNEFAEKVLEKFMEMTESDLGAFYLLDKEASRFSPLAGIGVNKELLATFDASIFEGEFGRVLKTGKPTHIRNIPKETLFTFKTFAGTAIPREILTLPIAVKEEVRAMLTLASLKRYPEAASTLLNHPSMIALNTAFANLLANNETRRLARELRGKNQELQAQQEELQAQTSELERQNEELEQQRLAVEEASRLKSHFLSNMSHELRTPLNSVMALSRVLLMQARTKLSPEEANYLEIIERNGKNLLALINDILDLSKIEAGRMDVHIRTFSLTTTLENLVESLSPLAGEKKIQLQLNIPEGLPSIESDEVRASQVLQNLLANAVKFTDEGSVSVSAESDGKTIRVQITDTGIGIGEQDLPYIFDEFRQVDGSSSRRHEGTGLGLAIARKTARMLGGDIGVSSLPGEGSIFTLTLPRAWQGTATAHDPPLPRRHPTVKPARKTILVVDDDPETAAMISVYLLQEGYNTITATSGEEALTLAVRDRPFAITLDIVMADMDGWEVLQGLKKNPETKNIPVIIVSVSDERETGFALGAIGYVTKPVSRLRLISEIRKSSPLAKRSVLIVDDNEVDRFQVRRIIEEEGLKPMEAEDGQGCLDLLKRQVPDVLVLDLMMPGMDGFAVLEALRRRPETRDLPVIVVTARDLTEQDREKLRGNVFSVLQKSPAAPATLLQEIKRILGDLEDSGAQRPQDPSARRKILLVEDNEAAILQVKSVLEGVGYRVDVARGGQEAIEYVAHTLPDGIVLDLMMPGMDGFEVLERIRGRPETAEIPVLILTAKDLTPEDFKRLNANHVMQLVQKGDVNRESLLSQIQSLLGEGDRPQGSAKMKPESPVSPMETRRFQEPHDKGTFSGTTSDIATILVVEDNPDNMITIRAVLQNRFRLMEARDGEEGLRVAREGRPDLILLDMGLPKMDGLTVVRYLKDDPALRSIPVIALTARAMKGDRETFIAAGCDDYLSKPIEPEGFLEKIAKWTKA